MPKFFFSVPPSFYHYLTPELNKDEKAEFTYGGRNMDALQALVDLLQNRLTITSVSYLYLNKSNFFSGGSL